jgi:hypothetical protein
MATSTVQCCVTPQADSALGAAVQLRMGPTRRRPWPTTGPAGLWFGLGGHGSRTPKTHAHFLKLWNPKLWMLFLIVWCVSGCAATTGAAEQHVDPLKLAALAVVGVGVGAFCECAQRESQDPSATPPTLPAALSDGPVTPATPATPATPVPTPNLRQSSRGQLGLQSGEHTAGAANTDGAAAAERTPTPRVAREQPEFKIIIDSIEYMIPVDLKARSELAKRLCGEPTAGNHKSLYRLMLSPVDGKCYKDFKFQSIGPPDCSNHRHMFDGDGGLHCILPNVIEFGRSVGMTHPRNLHQVLNGTQSQCNGWRTSLELLLSPEGAPQQAFARNTELKQNHQWSRNAFCKSHKLDASNVAKVFSEEHSHHQGWRLCGVVDADSYAVHGDQYLDQAKAPHTLKRSLGLTEKCSSTQEPLPKPKFQITCTLNFFFEKINDSSNAQKVSDNFISSVQCPREVHRALGCTRLQENSLSLCSLCPLC